MENNQKAKYDKPVTDNEYEVCTDCGVQTDIKVDTPIAYRKWYVYGSGQLCRKCWLEIYGKTGESEDSIM